MKTVRGDLLQLAAEGHFDVIVHGCNCQCQMGRGIASSLRRRYPAVYQADLGSVRGDREKLGTYTQATVRENGHAFVVVNAYTQEHWRGKGVRADYAAIGRALTAVAREFHGRRIGYPRIGAGLAGGDWPTIAAIIEQALAGEDHTLVEFDG